MSRADLPRHGAHQRRGHYRRGWLTNVYGTQPVFGATYLGLHGGAAVAGGSNRQLTFGGSPQVTTPQQEDISDPVDTAVEATAI